MAEAGHRRGFFTDVLRQLHEGPKGQKARNHCQGSRQLGAASRTTRGRQAVSNDLCVSQSITVDEVELHWHNVPPRSRDASCIARDNHLRLNKALQLAASAVMEWSLRSVALHARLQSTQSMASTHRRPSRCAARYPIANDSDQMAVCWSYESDSRAVISICTNQSI